MSESTTTVDITRLHRSDGEVALNFRPIFSDAAQDQIVSKIYARQNLPLLFDISYNPWPSDLGSYWKEHGGGAVLGGIEMLLWQASVQVELFTGLPAPVDAMRAALSNGLSTT